MTGCSPCTASTWCPSRQNTLPCQETRRPSSILCSIQPFRYNKGPFPLSRRVGWSLTARCFWFCTCQPFFHVDWIKYSCRLPCKTILMEGYQFSSAAQVSRLTPHPLQKTWHWTYMSLHTSCRRALHESVEMLPSWCKLFVRNLSFHMQNTSWSVVVLKVLRCRIVESWFQYIFPSFSWSFPVASTRINLCKLPHLLAPSVPTGARIQFSGYPKESFERELASGLKSPTLLPASAAICHATAQVSTGCHGTAQVASPRAQIYRRRPADAFLTKPIVLGPPLVSIGPHTDTILDWFELGDEILPKLHTLIATVRNTCWEENMCSPKMGLNYEQASKLNWALHADLQLGSSFRVSKDLIFDTLHCTNVWHKASSSSSIWQIVRIMALVFFVTLAGCCVFYLFYLVFT